MIKKLEGNELDYAVILMSSVFNRPSSVSDIAVRTFADNVYAFEVENEVISILCACEIKNNERKGYYLFGGATQESHRNQGLFTKLVTHAQIQLAADFYCLKRNTEYTNYFENLGYSNSFYMRRLNKAIKRNLWARADFDTITAKKLIELRNKFAKQSAFTQSADKTAAFMHMLYSNGITTAQTDNAYALFYRKVDKLDVIELYANTDYDAVLLLEAMGNNQSKDTATITLSCDNTVFLGEGQKYSNGMLSDNINSVNAYLGALPE